MGSDRNRKPDNGRNQRCTFSNFSIHNYIVDATTYRLRSLVKQEIKQQLAHVDHLMVGFRTVERIRK